MNFATRAIHAGQGADPATGATIIPIHLSATYTQEEIGKHKGYEYSRTGNPTRTALEQCLASLESGKYGLAFASGLAASSAVLSLLSPGDHVVAAEDLYGGTYRLFDKIYSPYGVGFTFVDGGRSEQFRAAIRGETKLVWLESPTNPLLHLSDIEEIARLCREHAIILAVDNTFATPYIQRPLTLGADIVVHSTTKYIGGHSDVVGGAVITDSDAIFQQVKFYQNAAGAVPGPFDCWLTLRGIKTLALRMRQHSENARKIAEFLDRHEKVQKTYYPGLAHHPQHELAARQMGTFGGMVSFEIKGGRSAANSFFKALRIFSFAESLGGVESLACYPPVMSHGSIPREERERRGINEGLIRLSVGIEEAEDLIEDILQALSSS
ncbi:MAG: cystathionine gamma-synthase [Syntrophobacteraceae bacterium]|jgi:cystathionine beta-lyase/cystathionine gamma-synthase